MAMIIVMHNLTWRPGLRGAALLPLIALLVSACGAADNLSEGSADTPQDAPGVTIAEATEQRDATPRLVVTYDGGLLVVDAASLDLVADIPMEGYNRLSPAGDGRHVAVSTTGGFRLLDTGTWAVPHGDHTHHYTAAPALTEVRVEAATPGHVVPRAGTTAFFDDASGEITLISSSDVAEPDADRQRLGSEAAHHGIAVVGDSGEIVSTLGDAESRVGLIARDRSGSELARLEDCPGVHGEAAADGALVFGCTDGVVTYAGGEFHKIDAPGAYGRIGNQAGSDVSPVVLGDYKVDEDADLERPDRVALIDTRDRTLQLVDLPASYSFRSLARGPVGEALVLGTDGRLHVIDPVTGELSRSIEVVEPWSEPLEWREPRPTLFAQGGIAYVTEPAAGRLVAVRIASGEVLAEAALPHVPDEVVGVAGDVTSSHG